MQTTLLMGYSLPQTPIQIQIQFVCFSVIIRCVCVYRHALKKHSSAGLAASETNGQTDRQMDAWMERRTETTKASLTLTLYGGTKVKPQNDA